MPSIDYARLIAGILPAVAAAARIQLAYRGAGVAVSRKADQSPVTAADQESEAVIEDFYRSARSGTIGDALRSAQSELMTAASSSHPFYWGAFFIVGDANKPLLSGRAQAQLLAAPAGVVSR